MGKRSISPTSHPDHHPVSLDVWKVSQLWSADDLRNHTFLSRDDVLSVEACCLAPGYWNIIQRPGRFLRDTYLYALMRFELTCATTPMIISSNKLSTEACGDRQVAWMMHSFSFMTDISGSPIDSQCFQREVMMWRVCGPHLCLACSAQFILIIHRLPFGLWRSSKIQARFARTRWILQADLLYMQGHLNSSANLIIHSVFTRNTRPSFLTRIIITCAWTYGIYRCYSM